MAVTAARESSTPASPLLIGAQLTGIATAMLDSSPVVCITGQVSSKLLGSDAFQEVDITGITMPITKYNVVVCRAEDIARSVREAFLIANSGRPGPCWWTLPRTRNKLPPISIGSLVLLNCHRNACARITSIISSAKEKE